MASTENGILGLKDADQFESMVASAGAPLRRLMLVGFDRKKGTTLGGLDENEKAAAESIARDFLRASMPSISTAGTPVEAVLQRAGASSSDGASVFLLSGFCLDENASAPQPGHSYFFNPTEQRLITPSIRGRILQGGSLRNVQKDIWGLQG
jgi:hypothetical protein